MVWAGASFDGKCPLVFINPEFKFDAEYYRQYVCENMLKPWAAETYGDNFWIYQQVSATFIFSYKTTFFRMVPHFIQQQRHKTGLHVMFPIT